MAARSYTDEQDALIRRLYPDTAALAVQIPGRSRENIRRRAWRLGLAKAAKHPRHAWTEAEDAVLRRLYPAVAAILRELPGMRRTQIKSRASQLGLSQPMATWTDAEDALLRAHPRDYDTLFAMMPGRTRTAIKSRTAALGIALPPAIWPPEDDAALRAHYPDYKAAARALPHRTYLAIKNRARVIGLTSGAQRGREVGPRRPWTEQEIALLGVYNAEIPGRTRGAIRDARVRFGIKVGNPAPDPARKAEAERRAAAWAETRQQAAQKRAAAEALRVERARQREADRQRRKAEREQQMSEAARIRRAHRALTRDERKAAQRERHNEQRRAKRAAANPERAAARAAQRKQAAVDATLREARSVAKVLARPAPAKMTRRPMDGSPWPETVALAARSRHGFELIPAIQTAARQVWPHMRGEVIDRVVRAVIAGEATPSDLAPAVAAALAAVQARQFAGAA